MWTSEDIKFVKDTRFWNFNVSHHGDYVCIVSDYHSSVSLFHLIDTLTVVFYDIRFFLQ